MKTLLVTLDLCVLVGFVASMLTIIGILAGCAVPVKGAHVDTVNGGWVTTILK